MEGVAWTMALVYFCLHDALCPKETLTLNGPKLQAAGAPDDLLCILKQPTHVKGMSQTCVMRVWVRGAVMRFKNKKGAKKPKNDNILSCQPERQSPAACKQK